MSWHYAAKKYVTDVEEYYTLVEVYPELEAHTLDPQIIMAESKEDLAKWLRLAADDVERFDLIVDGD